MKKDKNKVSWLTCYDYSFASALNASDLDLILVGDSGGMVNLGYKNTNPVTMDEMITLTSAVRRGAPDKFVIGDMPKGSYEVSTEKAIENAMRFAKESDCDAVKLEGGLNMVNQVKLSPKVEFLFLVILDSPRSLQIHLVVIGLLVEQRMSKKRYLMTPKH